MPWKAALKPRAKRQLAKLDRSVQKRLLDFMDRLSGRDDPRELGRALQGHHQLYKFRVGDYRIIAQIQEEALLVVVKLGHRREVYRELDGL
ncbi:MAG: type II toxin-antitoxin system RelE/ParE family toxin [Thiocapsa sp.]|uniref:type II toxin-antitoxin system RelE family toxin n=1 Tax=Thiocapsa sp. TaxID=2024551 RepID=UPI001BCC812B|nr:type II toxin-antitoxin system RelE/ParE family toxin [Thiocapsa sp.]QVL48694.1 MAG: type II toxin-antitoxin system RelE/ParE family toxin [Thiocapsa sp.]